MKYYVYTTDEKNAIDNYSDILSSEDNVSIDDIRNLLKEHSAYEFKLMEIGKPESCNYIIPYNEEGFLMDMEFVALHDKNNSVIEPCFDDE